MILVNGSEVIGTGWSSFIPNYNPRDIVNNLKRLINDEEPIHMHPWYRGFQGDIEQISMENIKSAVKSVKSMNLFELPNYQFVYGHKIIKSNLNNG
ncbi:DNA gyrase/topoisomerase IV, subunit A-domain-containing protein, partial [Glomus cerebriforme]